MMIIVIQDHAQRCRRHAEIGHIIEKSQTRQRLLGASQKTQDQFRPFGILFADPLYMIAFQRKDRRLCQRAIKPQSQQSHQYDRA